MNSKRFTKTGACISCQQKRIKEQKKYFTALFAAATFVIIIILMGSCRKVPVGFLKTEYAGYAPDSLVVKAVLDTSYKKERNYIYDVLISMGYTPAQLADRNFKYFFVTGPVPEFTFTPNNPQDFNRSKNKIPWVTVPIQGLYATYPLTITISNIKGNTTDSEKLKKLIHIRGASGVMEIPFDHGLSPGRYVVTLRLTNEGWDKELKDVFTFVLQ